MYIINSIKNQHPRVGLWHSLKKTLSVSRTTSRFPHFFAQFGTSRTILHNFKYKNQQSMENGVEFRQKLGSVYTIGSSLDKTGFSLDIWVEFRQKLGSV